MYSWNIYYENKGIIAFNCYDLITSSGACAKTMITIIPNFYLIFETRSINVVALTAQNIWGKNASLQTTLMILRRSTLVRRFSFFSAVFALILNRAKHNLTSRLKSRGKKEHLWDDAYEEYDCFSGKSARFSDRSYFSRSSGALAPPSSIQGFMVITE